MIFHDFFLGGKWFFEATFKQKPLTEKLQTHTRGLAQILCCRQRPKKIYASMMFPKLEGLNLLVEKSHFAQICFAQICWVKTSFGTWK